jgi:murein L,D-transpeptidase YcbB/YkuD
MRPTRRALLALLALALAGCAGAPERPAAPVAAPPPETPRSDFQRRIDRAGIPLDLPAEGKAILVNVPAFELVAFEDAEPVLRSPVIVGTPRNPTPIIDTHVSTVRFRPSWRPTPSMIASGEYEDRRWPPGRGNPLGLAAIRLEPGLLVYLHDTNRRGLFEREERALSHGCIRVEKWDEVIAWLLGWDLARVRRMAGGGRTRDVPAPPVPVLIRYYTAFPGPSGAVERHADIYDRREAPLAAANGAACEPVR